MQVPIHGTIESDIWTMGQSLRCTFDPQEQRASTILTVYTTKYPNIVFVDTPQEDVLLKEISRETQQGETAIRFSVDVTIEPNSAMMRTINIVPADTTIAPFAIPLYCHREE